MTHLHLNPRRWSVRLQRQIVPFILVLALVAGSLLTGQPLPVRADGPNRDPIQTYYIPFPESELLTNFRAISNNNTPSNPITTYISIAAIAANTIIYYDHWENGFDADIANPANLYSASNLGGTQIWGDGNPANGVPPGIPSDIIRPGTTILLNNTVNSTSPQTIDYDGRDKIGATKPIAVTRTGWATGSNTYLASSVEVFDTNSWGTEYRVPVGEDIADNVDYQMFEVVALSIMAGPQGATVSVDANADGDFNDTYDSNNVVLNEGETLAVPRYVYTGARVTSNNPVQVHFITGDRGSSYESRDSALLPVNKWSNSYYTPVSTPSSAQGYTGTDTTVWLYNPNTSSLSITYERRVSGTLTTSTITVPGRGVQKQVLPENTGAHFSAASNFYAFSATDSNNATTSGNGSNIQYSNNQNWDWGFTLIPQTALTKEVLIGLGIGRDPTSGTNPNENGNPVWVTPVGNGNTAVTVYVDYDADPTTGSLIDPYGNRYDVSYSLRELEQQKIYDSNDRNQSGTLIYILQPGVMLAAAWGQDPLTASAAQPGLDAGTSVPPCLLFAATISCALVGDNDGDSFISPGDELEYTILIQNFARSPQDSIQVSSTLPADTTYVPGSTRQDGTAVPDNAAPATAFPLDNGGLDTGTLNGVSERTVTYRVLVDDFSDLTPGTTTLSNSASVTSGSVVNCTEAVVLYGQIGDRVWEDTNTNGIQDAGEPGIAGVTVRLLNSSGTELATTTTNANGEYRFTGVAAGNYRVDFVLPTGYAFVTRDAGSDDTVDSDANVSTGETANFALRGGETITSVDAGMRYTLSRIGDFVWDDANGNGIQDAGETGIAGVTVRLRNGNNNNLISTTTTDANGKYLFAGLSSGNYRVEFVLPTGYIFTSRDAGSDDTVDSDANASNNGRTDSFSLGSNVTNTSFDAGLRSTAGRIGDRVWNDTNGNGIQDAGETGIASVTVRLLNGSGTQLATTTTDANGNYQFTGLVSGNYIVDFVLPTGYVFTGQDAGSDDAADSDAHPTTGETAVIALASGAAITSVDAGLRSTAGRIGDRVWDDADGDGIQDVGETGISGVTVRLLNGDNGNLITTVTTGANGNYQFTGLVSGNYIVDFVLPTGYVFTGRDIGANDAVDSDAHPTTGETAVIALASDATITSVDAGLRSAIGQIGDRVWNDVDGDGVQDAGEAGIAGVTVRLLDSAGNQLGTTVTDVNGGYLFVELVSGSYTVDFVLPDGYVFTSRDVGSNDAVDSDANPITGDTAVIALANREVNTSIDAGLRSAKGRIGDRVWDDADGDGIQDAAETGIAGVTVRLLDGSGNELATTTTDANGDYQFSNLVPGNYIIDFVLPTGYVFAPQNAGSDDTVDSDANPTTGETAVIALAENETLSSVDAGLRSTAGRIGDRVWDDADGDGIQDASETGISGVVVRLLDGSGNELSTTTTGANGDYQFTGLVSGNYMVDFVLPTGYVFTGRDIGSDDAVDSDASPATGETGVIALASREVNTSIDAGLRSAQGRIGDRVWDDTDGDGVQDASETGIAGVVVRLLDGSGNELATTTTDANGDYQFSNLVSGNYIIDFVLPTGYVFTGRDAGSDDAADSDANPTTGETAVITLAEFENLSSVDAGLRSATGQIGDRVWNDTNGNGIQDDGETGIAGVTVRLLDSSGNQLGTTVTDVNGGYLFVDLVSGNYIVDFVLPTGYVFTGRDAGSDDAADSDANPSTGETAVITLAEKETLTSADAGLRSTAGRIGDRVWVDTNGNGVQDAGETGFAGVTVRLLDSSGNELTTTTTDANGNYVFTGLVSGNYGVDFVLPSSYIFTGRDAGSDDALDSDANPTTGETGVIALTSGETNYSIDAGLRYAAGQIGDRVWDDADGDGIQDASEAGIAGVTVRLLDGSGNELSTTTTDANGSYGFSGLVAGDYIVDVVLPAGYIFTGRDAGSDDTADSDANPTTGETAVITLTGGAAITSVDAGLRATTGQIGDRVWEDVDGDGIQDASETGIAGVTVRLLDGAGNELATTTTGENGDYLFTGLVSGNYIVAFALPDDYAFASQNAGSDDALDSDVNPATGETAVIALTSGEVNTGIDAGLRAATGQIGDRVWNDVNGNGIQDTGEAGIAGVTVRLLDGSGNELATTATDANGSYLFAGLVSGDYIVDFVLPDHYAFTGSNAGSDDTLDSDASLTNGETAVITLASRETNTSIDAGLRSTLGRIGDRVWNDADGDGIQDAAETGLAGVTVRLLDEAGNVLATTTTDENGAYEFADLVPGSYIVEFVAPATHIFTPADQGSDDASDSDANPANGRTGVIPVAAWSSYTSIDAGLALKAPTLTLDKSASPSTAAAAGDGITYTYRITNSGNVPLSGPFSVTDDKVAVTPTAAAVTLLPGQWIELSAAYTFTQQDMDAGAVTNTASAAGFYMETEVVSNSDSETVSATQLPAIDLVKTAVTAVLENGKVGDPVHFLLKVTNTGNVTLNNVTITDTLLGTLEYSADQTTWSGTWDGILSVGEIVYARGSAVTTRAQFDAGEVQNSATASGRGPKGNSVSDTGAATVTLEQKPAIQLVLSGSGDGWPILPEGIPLTWSYTVTNTGNVTLTDVVVSDSEKGVIGTIPTLAAGETVTLTRPGVVVIGAQQLTATAAAAEVAGVSVSDTRDGAYTGIAQPAKTGENPFVLPMIIGILLLLSAMSLFLIRRRLTRHPAPPVNIRRIR